MTQPIVIKEVIMAIVIVNINSVSSSYNHNISQNTINSILLACLSRRKMI